MVKKSIIILSIILLVALATLTTGCLDELEDAAEGKIVITGTVETVSEPPLYTYNFIVGAVVNGPAKINKFEFKLEDKDDDTVVKGKDGHIGTDGTGITITVNQGDDDKADIGDTFSIVVTEDCAGGELKVYYDGDKVNEYDV